MFFICVVWIGLIRSTEYDVSQTSCYSFTLSFLDPSAFFCLILHPLDEFSFTPQLLSPVCRVGGGDHSYAR